MRCSPKRCATPNRTARVPLRASDRGASIPGATADHIQVTNGGSEANYITTWNLVEPGDEVVMMVPNYMQTWGLARAFGATVKEWPLVEPGANAAECAGASTSTRSSGWSSPRTKLIIDLQSEQPDRRALRCRRSRSHRRDRRSRTAAGSSSDEIYRGAERDGRETPTIWGRSDRVIVTSGLSKAYGLPGLRIGWIVGPPRSHRVAVVVSRLHHDRAGRAERRARASRARAGAPRTAAGAHARAS